MTRRFLIPVLMAWTLALSPLFAQTISIGPTIAKGPTTKSQSAAPPTPPSIAHTCIGSTFSGTTQTCAAMNVTAGDVLVVALYTVGAGTLSVSGCGITFATPDTQVIGSTKTTGTAVSTASCTLTAAITGGASAISIVAVDVTNVAVGIDTCTVPAGACNVAMASSGVITSPANINCPALTTINADLVLCIVIDTSAQSDTFTAVAPFTFTGAVQTTSFGTGIEQNTQSVAGAITGAMTSNKSATFGVSAVAIR